MSREILPGTQVSLVSLESSCGPTCRSSDVDSIVEVKSYTLSDLYLNQIKGSRKAVDKPKSRATYDDSQLHKYPQLRMRLYFMRL